MALLIGFLLSLVPVPPDAAAVRFLAPRGAPVATLHVASSDSGRPTPFVCGVIGKGAAGRVDVVSWWRDASGRSVPVVRHLLPGSGRLLVHGVHPGPTRKTTRLFAGGAVGSSSRLGLRRDGAEWALAGVPSKPRFLPGGFVRIGGVRVGLKPGFHRNPSWSVLHRCPLRVDLMIEGSLESTSAGLEATLVVTAWAGCPELEWSLHVRARSRAALKRGLQLELEADTGMHPTPELSGHPLPEGTVLHRRDGAWWRGREVIGSELGVTLRGAGVALTVAPAAGPRPGFATMRSRGSAGIGLSWRVGGALERGEGRILRARLNASTEAARGRSLLVPRRPARKLHGRPLIRPMMASDDRLARAASALVDRFLDEEATGIIREAADAGDWRMSREDLGNLEFDTVAGLLRHGLARGSCRVVAAARAAADHLVGFDRDAEGSGLFFPHGPGHRVGLTEPGHHWIDGLVELEAWFADPLVSRALDRILEDQLRHFARCDLHRLRPRSLGWGLRALSWAGRARDTRRYRREIDRWRRFLLSRRTETGLLRLARSAPGEDFFGVSPLVQGGIVVPALAESLAVMPSTTGRRMMQRLARSLAEHAVVRGRDGEWQLATSLQLAGRRPEIVARMGEAPGEQVALFLAGLARADRALLARPGPGALRRSLADRLGISRQRYLGRELSLLLAALPILLAEAR